MLVVDSTFSAAAKIIRGHLCAARKAHLSKLHCKGQRSGDIAQACYSATIKATIQQIKGHDLMQCGCYLTCYNQTKNHHFKIYLNLSVSSESLACMKI